MAEQRENSVLFSLKELRRLEDDRIRQEQDEVKARADAERRARDDAERRAREEIERQHREEEDRIRRIEEERLAREREEQFRLEEADRRARIDGEMRLQEERMRLELQAKRSTKSPMGAILGVAVVAVLLGGGIIYKLKSDADAALQAKEAEKIRTEQETQARMDAERRKYEALINEKNKELSAAKTEEERSRIREEIRREQQRLQQRPGRRPEVAPGTPSQPKPQIREKKQISDDPLEGI